MSDATTSGASAADDVQRQMLEMIERNQRAIIDSVRQWREAGERAMPNLPQMPANEMFPSPEEVVRGQFDFAERLLAAQRKFTEDLLAAMRPPSQQGS
jgi:hypothetical protein